MQRRVAADAFELHRLFEPVAGNIGLNLGDHILDARPDRGAVAIVAQAIDDIAHDERRFGGVEEDDSLSAGRTGANDDRLASLLCELVDTGAVARIGDFRRNYRQLSTHLALVST